MESGKKSFSTIMLMIIMEEESKPLIQALSLTPDPNFSNPICDCLTNSYKSLKLFLFKPKKDPKFNCDSVGSEIAALTTYIGINYCKPDLLINAGSSGGILNNTQELNIGDVCVAKEGIAFFDREMIIKEFEDYQNGKYEIVLFEKIVKKLNLKEVIVGTTSSFTNDPSLAKKQNVHVVEMEAAAIGKVCFWFRVPFFVLKVISDVDEPDQQKKAKMFENHLGNVSEILACKIQEFLNCIDLKEY